jgi:hypothetical protein
MTEDDPAHRMTLADIVNRKDEGRRELARLSFGEKIARIQVLRERLRPLKLAREDRRRAAGSADAPSG